MPEPDPVDIVRLLRDEEHVLAALLVALERRHELVDLVAEADDVEDARARIRTVFGFDAVQADAVLALQVRRLPRGERTKLAGRLAEVREQIAGLTGPD